MQNWGAQLTLTVQCCLRHHRFLPQLTGTPSKLPQSPSLSVIHPLQTAKKGWQFAEHMLIERRWHSKDLSLVSELSIFRLQLWVAENVCGSNHFCSAISLIPPKGGWKGVFCCCFYRTSLSRRQTKESNPNVLKFWD